MNSVPTPNRDIQSRTTSAVNSGPLSDLMCSGIARCTNNSPSRASTFSESSFRSTSIARHSRVYSSTTDSLGLDTRPMLRGMLAEMAGQLEAAE